MINECKTDFLSIIESLNDQLRREDHAILDNGIFPNPLIQTKFFYDYYVQRGFILYKTSGNYSIVNPLLFFPHFISLDSMDHVNHWNKYEILLPSEIIQNEIPFLRKEEIIQEIGTLGTALHLSKIIIEKRKNKFLDKITETIFSKKKKYCYSLKDAQFIYISSQITEEIFLQIQQVLKENGYRISYQENRRFTQFIIETDLSRLFTPLNVTPGESI